MKNIVIMLFSLLFYLPTFSQIYPKYGEEGFGRTTIKSRDRRFIKIETFPKPQRIDIDSKDEIFSVALWEQFGLVVAAYDISGVNKDAVIVGWDIETQEVLFEKRIFLTDVIELEHSFITFDTTQLFINIDAIANEYQILKLRSNVFDSLVVYNCDSLRRMNISCSPIESKMYRTLVHDNTRSFYFSVDKGRNNIYVSIYIPKPIFRKWRNEIEQRKEESIIDSLINKKNIPQTKRDSLYESVEHEQWFKDSTKVLRDEVREVFLLHYWKDKKLFK